MLPSMLLIATALTEELEIVLNLCSRRRKVRGLGISVWEGVRGEKSLHVLKLGAGPARAASALERALAGIKAAHILNIGYAGALDPDLKQGELVAVDEAALLSEKTWGAPLGELELGECWPLASSKELCSMAHAAGLPIRRGSALTSFCIIGAPSHKRLLFQKFHAAIVDMETAALARVAHSAAVPMSCVRAVTDEADDDFLATLTYAPADGSFRRAAKTLAAGGWLRRYSQWRERSLAARKSLSRFLACYLNQE
jgi:adenosylhomocysteine nucleosidase